MKLNGKPRFQGEQNDENKNNTIHYNSSGFANRPYWVYKRGFREK